MIVPELFILVDIVLIPAEKTAAMSNPVTPVGRPFTIK